MAPPGSPACVWTHPFYSGYLSVIIACNFGLYSGKSIAYILTVANTLSWLVAMPLVRHRPRPEF